MKPVPIALIEDDIRFRKEFREILETFAEVESILEFSSAEECLDADLSGISFFFIDIGLSGMKGIDLLIKLGEMYPDPAKIMVTRLTTDSNLFESLRFGAVGFIMKSDLMMIHEILPSIFRGGFYISPPIAVHLIHHFQSVSSKTNPSPLTEAEHKVLVKLSDGFSVEDICALMGVKKSTIQFHIRGIYRALQVSNRAQMIKKANELKIIP